MWTVIYLSQSYETAKKLTDALWENGIISKLRRANTDENDTTGCFEVLVPGSEMQAAQDLIIEDGLF